jgi:hypothetical protein
MRFRGRGKANLSKESVGERIYIARKKKINTKRKTIKIKEYIVLGYDSVV